jgi:hypothetical protein
MMLRNRWTLPTVGHDAGDAAMGRYFFDIDDGTGIMRDEIGLNCNSLLEARNGAIAALPEIAADETPNGQRRDYVVRVRDGTGCYLFEAFLSFEVRWLGPLPN